MMLVALWTLLLIYSNPISGSHADWSYHHEATGPDNWPGICNRGVRQSPINIHLNTVHYFQAEDLQFTNYDKSGPVTLLNNGHSIVAQGFDKWAERPSLSSGGLDATYDLLQWHFHWARTNAEGSEHELQHLHYPLEAHLVHVKRNMSFADAAKIPDGLAVVAVFYAIGPNGTTLKHLEKSLRKTIRANSNATVASHSPSQMIPVDRSMFYRYEGSLTVPMCQESVIWTILAEPMFITQKQMKLLRDHKDADGHLMKSNNRPTLPLNGRTILERRPLGYGVKDIMDRNSIAHNPPDSATVTSLSQILMAAAIFIGFFLH